MFTGIVEEVGAVRSLRREADAARLVVACDRVLEGTRLGDSISVNGCCLTVTARVADAFGADVMGESLARTALGDLAEGSPVNLERAVPINGRLGGHLVQGHVDAVARVVAVEPARDWTTMTFSLPPALSPYVVEKGSVTVDGVSLTVTAVGDATFSVGLIPHTLAVTVLGRRRVSDAVNLEADVVAKYVERLLRTGAPTPYGKDGL